MPDANHRYQRTSPEDEVHAVIYDCCSVSLQQCYLILRHVVAANIWRYCYHHWHLLHGPATDVASPAASSGPELVNLDMESLVATRQRDQQGTRVTTVDLSSRIQFMVSTTVTR